MTKLIDKIMPYKVVLETVTKEYNGIELYIKGFTKRFMNASGLDRYVRSGLTKKTFNWNYLMEDNTCYVFPGESLINKVAQKGI